MKQLSVQRDELEHAASVQAADVPGMDDAELAEVTDAADATDPCPLGCPCDSADPVDPTDPADCIPDEELLYDLADLFKVFSDTTRIKILYSLMGRELCVADIAEATSSTQSAVSHQLRILKQARLVRFKREGRNIMYSLADNHVYTMLAQGMTHICE